MNDIELLAELVGDIARDLRPVIEPLTLEQLYWEPGPQVNSIGVTLWHIARGLDFLGLRVVDGKAAGDELWHISGWRTRTGYDPRGKGYSGEAFTGDLESTQWAREEAMEEIVKSWEKIRALGAKHVYPGHGPVMDLER